MANCITGSLRAIHSTRPATNESGRTPFVNPREDSTPNHGEAVRAREREGEQGREGVRARAREGGEYPEYQILLPVSRVHDLTYPGICAD